MKANRFPGRGESYDSGRKAMCVLARMELTDEEGCIDWSQFGQGIWAEISLRRGVGAGVIAWVYRTWVKEVDPTNLQRVEALEEILFRASIN